jgi:hypothetical protein
MTFNELSFGFSALSVSDLRAVLIALIRYRRFIMRLLHLLVPLHSFLFLLLVFLSNLLHFNLRRKLTP